MNKQLLTAVLATGFATTAMAQDDFKWQPFYTQTYENVVQIGDVWTAPSNQGGLSLAEENGNHYVLYNHGNNNSRGLYNLDALTADLYEGIEEYRLEFDLALTSGNNQNSTFSVGGPDIQTMGKDWETPCGNITSYPNNGLGSGSLFSLIQDSQNSTSWRVYSQGPVGRNDYFDMYITEDGNENGDYDPVDYRIDLAAGAWYHFALTVSPATDAEWTANVTAEVTDAEGNPVMFTKMANSAAGVEEESLSLVTVPYADEGNGYWFKQFYVLSGRYNSVMKIDNIQVMKKAAAGSVTPPSLAMTGVYLESRIVSLDNGAETDLLPYYAIVDAETFEAATTPDGLEGIEYTAPFSVKEELNYILAWNKNKAGKPSELTKLIVEAGWAPQLNAPTISATDFIGRKKTYTASCFQGDVKPFAPLSYTIYMSADGENWTEGNTYTVTSGLVYAKVEADGYLASTCDPVEAPEGIYGSTKWSVEGMVITNQDCVLESTGETYLNFSNSGRGRVHVPVQYWSEDYEGDNAVYDSDNAWAPLKKNGMHFIGGTGDMFILGSGNANGFTITGITVYNSNTGKIKIDNLYEGDIVQVAYADGSAQVLTVNDPETFTVSVPKYGAAALASISIKGAGTVNTRETKVGEWGFITSDRNVVDVEQAGAIFYEHVYTIYNEEDNTHADTLLLKPVHELKAGYAYIYQATADEIELVTLEAEDPEYPSEEQMQEEGYTLIITMDDPDSGTGYYTMFPGGILMKNENEVEIPVFSGCYYSLDESYIDVFDYKLTEEYAGYLAAVEKAIEDHDKLEPEKETDPVTGEDIIIAPVPELDVEALYKEKYAALLSSYTIVPVLHTYDENIATPVASVVAPVAKLVNVVTPAGVVVRRGVKAEDALKGLQHGLYIVGKQKVVK